MLRATLLFVALLVPGAAIAQPASPQEVRVNFLARGEPETLDPNRGSFTPPGGAAVVRQLFEPLLRFDETLTPQPAAAESFEVSADGTLYTFHLRQDGYWSDGQAVSASQFEYSWKRLLDQAMRGDYAALFADASIDSVRAVDEHTLEVRLNQPFAPLPNLAALWVAVPLRQDVVEANPDGWARDPTSIVGNGPFMVSDWVHQDHITLVQNPRYVAHFNWPKPTITRATLSMMLSGEADLEAYMRNDRDWIVVPDAEVNQVLNDPSLAPQSRQYNELTTFWIQINNTRGPLSNVNVRRALAKGLNRAAIVRDMAMGISAPITSIIPRGMPGFQEGVGRELDFDPDGAKALLAQAGFPNGQGLSRLTFSFPSSIAAQRRAEYLQAQWKQNLGMDIQLRPMDGRAYQQAFADKNYDLAFGGWTADYPDPHDWFSTLFGCKAGYNKYNYCNPTFDQMVARADAAALQSDRVMQYNQAQTILLSDVPVVPLFTRGRLVLVKPWVQAVDGGPLPISPLDEYPGSFFLDKVQILPH